jgi:hypothetical protein
MGHLGNLLLHVVAVIYFFHDSLHLCLCFFLFGLFLRYMIDYNFFLAFAYTVE